MRVRRLITTYALCGLLGSILPGNPAIADLAPIPGSPDPSFGDDGTAVTDLGSEEEIALDSVVQPDGKIVATGYVDNSLAGVDLEDIAVVRYNTDGTPDPSFGNAGTVVTVMSGLNRAFAVGLEPDGQILVAGERDGAFVVVRYETDGDSDSTFGTSGTAEAAFPLLDVAPRMVEALPSGKVLVVGSTDEAGIALARFDQYGTLDATFGTGGMVVTTPIGGTDVEDAVVQDDGKIVVAGEGNQPINGFGVARLNPGGSFDNSFDGDGWKTHAVGQYAGDATAVDVMDNGKIVAAGRSPFDFAVMRFNADGTMDSSFDGDGVFEENIGGGTASSVEVLPGGAIIVGGPADDPGGQEVFTVLCIRKNGTLEPDFLGGGASQMALGPDGLEGAVTDVEIDADERIVAVGWARHPFTSVLDFAVARLEGLFFRPDAKVRTSVGAFGGDDVYNSTGLNQTKIVGVHRGSATKFVFQVENEANVADRFRLDGNGSNTGFLLNYFPGLQGGNAVTGAVMAGSYLSAQIDAGASATFRVAVRVRKGTARGTVGKWTLKAAADGDPQTSDTVGFRVKALA